MERFSCQIKSQEFEMILKKDGLGVNEFKRLIDFLGDWESEENYLAATNVAEAVSTSDDPVIIDEKGRAWKYLSPCCRLVSVKHSYYDMCELQFDVVVEIPDEVSITWVPKGRDLDDVRSPKSEAYLVNNQETFIIMLNAIFNGEEPKDALKRLGLSTE